MNERDKTAHMMQDSAGMAWGTEEHFQRFANLIRADERDIWARDADWCIQNHLEHLIPERIRARGNK